MGLTLCIIPGINSRSLIPMHSTLGTPSSFSFDCLAQVFVTVPPSLQAPSTSSAPGVPPQLGTTGPYLAKQQQRGPLTLTGMLGPPDGADVLEPGAEKENVLSGGTGTAGGIIPERPCLYACAPPADASQSAWPNPELPFIRHWLTREAAGFGETPAM
jgi:hypothetical protein